jgi:hypothetical protein
MANNSLEKFIEKELSNINCILDECSVKDYSLDGFYCARCSSKDLTFFALTIKDSCLYDAYYDGVCENCKNKLRVYLKTIVNLEDSKDD